MRKIRFSFVSCRSNAMTTWKCWKFSHRSAAPSIAHHRVKLKRFCHSTLSQSASSSPTRRKLPVTLSMQSFAMSTWWRSTMRTRCTRLRSIIQSQSECWITKFCHPMLSRAWMSLLAKFRTFPIDFLLSLFLIKIMFSRFNVKLLSFDVDKSSNI